LSNMAVALQNIDIMAELAKLATAEGREETVAWLSGVWAEDGLPQLITIQAAYLAMVAVTITLMEILPKSIEGGGTIFRTVQFVHNFAMALFAGYVLQGSVTHILDAFERNSWDWGVMTCDNEMTMVKGGEIWFQLFFWGKFAEYADSLFLISKRKYANRVGWWLQVYHHSTTASLAWAGYWGNVPCQWWGIITNSFVHVLMYFYFAFVDVFPGLKKFGHLITIVQVTQFYSCIIMAVNVVYQIDIAHNVDCPKSSFWHRMWVCWLYVSFQGMFMLFDRARKARMRSKKKDSAKAQ